jgi:hypothetical protein
MQNVAARAGYVPEIESGARSIDAGNVAKIKSVPVEGRPNAGTTRVPYSGQEPAPYRASAKAAAKADKAATAASALEDNPPIYFKGEEITPESNPTLYKALKGAGGSKATPAAESTTEVPIGRTASEEVKPAAASPTARPSVSNSPEMAGDRSTIGADRTWEGAEPKTDLNALAAMSGRGSQSSAGVMHDLENEIATSPSTSSTPRFTFEGEAVQPGHGMPPGPAIPQRQPPGGISIAGLSTEGTPVRPGMAPPPGPAIGDEASLRPSGQPVPNATRPGVTRVGGPAPAAPPVPPVAPTAPAGPIQGGIRIGGQPGGVFAPKPIKAPGSLETLWQKHGAEEAGTLFAKQNPGAFGKLPKTTRTNLVREAMAKAGTPDAGGLLPEEAQAVIDAKVKTLTTDTAKRAYLLKAPNSAAFNYIYKMLDRGGLAAKFNAGV